MQTNHTPQTPVWHGLTYTDEEVKEIVKAHRKKKPRYLKTGWIKFPKPIPNSEIFKFEEKKD